MLPSFQANGGVYPDHLTLRSQIEKIQGAIEEVGESIVSCAELRLLCDDKALAHNQWNAVARIAINEAWRFTYFPNGSVRFAKLNSN
jgi:hypothetical protein